jgi:hypothetical protein
MMKAIGAYLQIPVVNAPKIEPNLWASIKRVHYEFWSVEEGILIWDTLIKIKIKITT